MPRLRLLVGLARGSTNLAAHVLGLMGLIEIRPNLDGGRSLF